MSQVEKAALERSGRKLQYGEHEHIGVVVVDNFPALGTLTALRFIEWVQKNPNGVVSLPTGRTPEFFIKELHRFQDTWHEPDTVAELESVGIDPSVFPHTKDLRFVQIDEFYPINPRHRNSFLYYIRKYYLEAFGIKPENALLIDGEEIGLPVEGVGLEEFWADGHVDLSLRYRPAKGRIEQAQQDAIARIDQWCIGYEDRIREMGGIGFFLGGIGPDGHIGFNVRGSSPYSATRLTEVNYETQAAAAADLGGIEVARERLVITIGLGTIAHNPHCCAVIMAAGESKADIVAKSIEHPRDVRYPATALHQLKNARFYLTEGAAVRLTHRNVLSFRDQEEVHEQDIDRIVIDLSLNRRKRIVDLTPDDYKNDAFAKLLLRKTGADPRELGAGVADRMREKIERGMEVAVHTRFLHTEPHHDDIMLGYLPSVVRNIREHSNYHHFATMTSGFTAVTNRYVLGLCRALMRNLKENRVEFEQLSADGYFADARYRDHDVWRYLDGLAANSPALQENGTVRRFYRTLVQVFEETEIEEIIQRLHELLNYFETQYPGKKDLPYIQQLKGMCREWESACLWGYFGWDQDSVENLRLGFYQGEIFTEEPTVSRDAVPVKQLMERVRPDVITVAFDPEASGPDTHYKVMQAISEALRMYREESGRSDVNVIGYRNIWYRFHPSAANVFVPVSLNMMTLQHHSFMTTYLSQKDASFPSYEHDGPFSELAQKIQVEQYDQLSCCLGREYFYEHPSALIRATRGFVYLKEMSADEFASHSRELRKKAEALS
ncbi:MAG: glucosamine-6-phosphate deaminase [Spirochaetaceae bacterium]|nr:MAG: glucosamine-6-phosphate deaminase [Spirochaetaceae bacterium]